MARLHALLVIALFAACTGSGPGRTRFEISFPESARRVRFAQWVAVLLTLKSVAASSGNSRYCFQAPLWLRLSAFRQRTC